MSMAIPFGPAPMGCARHKVIVARGMLEPGLFGMIVGDSRVDAYV